MDNTTAIFLDVFVVICAVALFGQFVCLAIVALTARKIQKQVMQVWPEVSAIIASTRRIVGDVEVQVKEIGKTTNSILATTKQQVAKVDELLTDLSTRAKVQMERAEMVLDDSLGRAQETVSIVQRTVLRPVRELNGVLAGIRTTIQHLGRGNRPTVDHATADEEMFI